MAGKSAVDAHRVARHLLRQATIAAPGLAQLALVAGQDGGNDDFLADHAGLAGHDHAGYLVAQRQRGRLLGTHAHVEVGQVGMANATTLDLDQHFARLQSGHGDFCPG
jgi:hypothetical protein